MAKAALALNERILLNDSEVSAMTGIAVRTLKFWRNSTPRQGPPVAYLGRLVRYPQDGLEAWIASRTAVPRPKDIKAARDAAQKQYNAVELAKRIVGEA